MSLEELTSLFYWRNAARYIQNAQGAEGFVSLITARLLHSVYVLYSWFPRCQLRDVGEQKNSADGNSASEIDLAGTHNLARLRFESDVKRRTGIWPYYPEKKTSKQKQGKFDPLLWTQTRFLGMHLPSPGVG